MSRRFGLLRGTLPLGAALAALLVFAPIASATFHLIKVREVHPSSGDDSYVELQMFAAGQNLLTTHSMTVYNTAGALVHSSTFSAGVGTRLAAAYGVALPLDRRDVGERDQNAHTGRRHQQPRPLVSRQIRPDPRHHGKLGIADGLRHDHGKAGRRQLGAGIVDQTAAD